jgi:hypothetical protein
MRISLKGLPADEPQKECEDKPLRIQLVDKTDVGPDPEDAPKFEEIAHAISGRTVVRVAFGTASLDSEDTILLLGFEDGSITVISYNNIGLIAGGHTADQLHSPSTTFQ